MGFYKPELNKIFEEPILYRKTVFIIFERKKTDFSKVPIFCPFLAMSLVRARDIGSFRDFRGVEMKKIGQGGQQFCIEK